MKTFSILLIFVLFCQASAAQVTSTVNMHDVFVTIEKLASRHGPKEVLAVFDVDDTLLTADHELGSHRWYLWQSHSLKTGHTDAVVKSFPQLYALQNVLFTLGRMSPPEAFIPEKIKHLQQLGVTVIALTSRGYPMRSATEKALSENGIDLDHHDLHRGFPGIYKPFYGKGRPVSFQRGIYMTAGQNKGLMLKDLLEKTETNYKAIVFVDDTKKHTVDMYQEYSFLRENLKVFHYRKLEDKTNKFLLGDKTKIKKQWRQLRSTWESVFKEPAVR